MELQDEITMCTESILRLDPAHKNWVSLHSSSTTMFAKFQRRFYRVRLTQSFTKIINALLAGRQWEAPPAPRWRLPSYNSPNFYLFWALLQVTGATNHLVSIFSVGRVAPGEAEGDPRTKRQVWSVYTKQAGGAGVKGEAAVLGAESLDLPDHQP